MRKLLVFNIILIIFSACGPSNEEIAQQEKCSEQYSYINEVYEFWKGREEEILVDELTAEAYRDELGYLEEEIDYYIYSCEEVDEYLVLEMNQKREKILKDVSFNDGYWKGKLESSG